VTRGVGEKGRIFERCKAAIFAGFQESISEGFFVWGGRPSRQDLLLFALLKQAWHHVVDQTFSPSVSAVLLHGTPMVDDWIASRKQGS
jgi:hypothetical protein